MKNKTIDSEDDKDKFYDKFFKKYILFFFGFISIILFLPLLLTWNKFSLVDFTKTGQIGDTIGGIIGPYIAIAAAFLTFLAFWAQYKANLSQVSQFEKQAKQFQMDRFETRFFELLKMHRDNVNQLKINENITGNAVFENYYKEFKALYGLIISATQKTLNSGVSIDKIFTLGNNSEEKDIVKKITDIAYECFFSGFSMDIFKYYSDTYKKEIEIRFDNAEIKHKTKKQLSLKYDLFDKDEKFSNLSFDYVYDFSGRQQHLGNYYRHLFSMVKYVVNQKDPFLNFDQKYEYIKIIRCQLSNYELVMLYYNGINCLGYDWINNEYFTEWRILKNIPEYLLDFGTSYCDMFDSMYNSKGKHIFGLD